MSGFNWSTQDYVYVTAECVTGVLSVLGNSLVLLAIARTRALQTITNCFIGSLAVADVLVGFLVPPTVILPYRGLPHNFYGCVLLNTVVVLITNISILNLLAVALERFLAISDPFRYHRLMTMRRALVVVAVTWVVAILLGLIPTMGWNLGTEGFQQCSFTTVIDMRYMIYLIFFGVTLPPLFFMLVIYLYIFRIIRKQQRAVAQLTVLSANERNTVRQQKREVRGAKGLAYVIVLFAVCWMPIHIMNSMTLFAPDRAAPLQLLLVAIVLSHANSFVNPFLYAFSNSKFKSAMLDILCCGQCKSATGPNSVDGTSRFATSRAPAEAPRNGSFKMNGHLGNAATETPHDQTPVEITTDIASKSSKNVLKGEDGSVSTDKLNGVVNNAFNVDGTDTPDEGQDKDPCVPAGSGRKLRWCEAVETIPDQQSDAASNMAPHDDPDSPSIDQANVFTITTTLPPLPNDAPVWATPSSSPFNQTKPLSCNLSNELQRRENSRPPSALLIQDQHFPGKTTSASVRASPPPLIIVSEASTRPSTPVTYKSGVTQTGDKTLTLSPPLVQS